MGICSSDLAVPAGEVAGGIQIRGHSENIHQRRRHGTLGGAETLPATSALLRRLLLGVEVVIVILGQREAEPWSGND